MGLFSRSFDKPGPGINPDAPQKRAFFRFFDIVSRKLWNFIKISLMYVALMLPISILYFLAVIAIGGTNDSITLIFFGYVVTNLLGVIFGGGPVTAGVAYIMRNYANEEHAWIWSDFKDNAKSNFKQAIIVFLADLGALVLFYVAIMVYSNLGGVLGVLKYIVYILLFLYTVMHFYIYPMMVTFKLSLKDLYKNAFLLALAKLPTNLFVLLVLVIIHIVVPCAIILYGGQFVVLYSVLYIVLEICLLQGLSLFLTNFAVAKTIKETMLYRVIED